LRYFKEQLPLLHVIGAGSLLEFALNDAEFRMPVGRIEFLYLRPLSFTEYLEASGHTKLKEYLEHVNLKTSIEQPIHEKLMTLIPEYFALGGMPAVLAEYFESKSLLRVQEIQTSILATFRKDFGKYAHRMPHKHLETIFTKAPGLIGQWLKYSTLDPSVSPETLRNAIDKLCDAGLISLVHATSGSGLPLVSHKNKKKRKFLFLDIGLVKRACNLSLEVLMQEDLQLINQGALAEQFVGQELLVTVQAEEANALFSWKREEKSSSAEIDFLVAIDRWIVPIEVKSGSIGALRSLKLFMTEKKIPLGMRISANNLSLRDSILSIPFYLIEQLPRLVGEAYIAL
jgi:predicted AAA+ superfamily ATPase